MSTFKVRKTLTYIYEAEIEAEDFDEAEEKARYDSDIIWEDCTDYNCDDVFDVEEED